MSINPTGRSGSISLNTNTSTTRQSGRTDFGAQIRNGLGTTAGVIGGAVSTAAPMVPGGAVVSAAVNGAIGGGSGGGTMGAQAGFAGAGDIPSNGPGLNSNTGTKSTGNAQQDLMNQTKEMQEMMQSFNLQYLQLQEKMQSENRQFSTISNVMKTKHDTAKTSIANVR